MLIDRVFQKIEFFLLPEFLVIIADGYFENQSILTRIEKFPLLNQTWALRSQFEALCLVQIDLEESLKS